MSSMEKGWAFPYQANRDTGRMAMTTLEDDVRQAIIIILKTRMGERVLRPTFGSSLMNFAFEVIDISTMSDIQAEVMRAITSWEDRIDQLEVKVGAPEQDAHMILIDISYRIKVSQKRSGMTFPLEVGS